MTAEKILRRYLEESEIQLLKQNFPSFYRLVCLLLEKNKKEKVKGGNETSNQNNPPHKNGISKKLY